MNKEAILGLVRHVLTTFGGSLVTHGMLAEADLNVAVGAVVAIAGVAWSMVEKKKRA